MLPIGTEPLVLADGTKINPIDGAIVQDEVLVEVPNTQQIQKEIVATRMRIADLPVPPEQMNTLSVILSYTLQGVSDSDIATLFHLDLEQLDNIKTSDPYKELRDTIVQNIIKSDASDVRNLFVEKSQLAADRVFSLLDSEADSLRLAAAKDILDRAGQRPVDVVEHRHHMEGGLTIKYVEESKEHIPTIDITPNKEF